MYTLRCDLIVFAHAQVIQAALKNTSLLRDTWREDTMRAFALRQSSVRSWFKVDNSWVPERGKPSMLAEACYYNMLVEIIIPLRVFKRTEIANTLPNDRCWTFYYNMLVEISIELRVVNAE